MQLISALEDGVVEDATLAITPIVVPRLFFAKSCLGSDAASSSQTERLLSTGAPSEPDGTPQGRDISNG